MDKEIKKAFESNMKKLISNNKYFTRIWKYKNYMTKKMIRGKSYPNGTIFLKTGGENYEVYEPENFDIY